MGLRELNADGQFGFDGSRRCSEFFAALPTPEEIINLRPSPRLAVRVAELIEKNKAAEMTPFDLLMIAMVCEVVIGMPPAENYAARRESVCRSTAKDRDQ